MYPAVIVTLRIAKPGRVRLQNKGSSFLNKKKNTGCHSLPQWQTAPVCVACFSLNPNKSTFYLKKKEKEEEEEKEKYKWRGTQINKDRLQRCPILSRFSRIRLFASPWTVAPRLLCPWDSPGKNTGVGCHFLLQGIFPTHISYVSCSSKRIPYH